MTNRENHYEAAFEEYLRSRQVPYVAVDEKKRSLVEGGSIKSLDFIVSPAGESCQWLVDVKGRRFPAGRGRQLWKNWSTGDDLRSLARWERVFGPRFHSLLVFAYHVVGDVAPLPADRLFEYRRGLYGFVAIRLSHYACWARTISPKWNTVAMPSGRFRALAEPVDALLGKTSD